MAAHSENLRHRSLAASNADKPATNTQEEKGRYLGHRKFLGEHLCFFLLISYFVFFGIVSWGHRHLPTPKSVSEYKTGDQIFIEERARNHLNKITSFGPRPAGSKANEVLAANFILKEITRIKTSSKKVHKIEIDVQKPNGSFIVPDIIGQPLSHVYKHLTNIIVRIRSSRRLNVRRRALLINAHFDSVPGSPGASDDAVSCAILLEILEVLSKSSDPFPHDLILLFNGAEENYLPASHGFITQHKWAKDIDAFINLDSAGGGGREILFQAGPNHPWLMEAYTSHARYPFATVIAQEIFQANLIPSDTDFRIFRDHGKIPGLDIAFISNGFVYHTEFDKVESIQPGCIQRAGDNVLSVASHLLTSDAMEKGLEDKSSDKAVFFDLLGLCMVSLPSTMVVYMTWGLIVANIGTVVVRRPEGFNGKPYIFGVIRALSVIFISWVGALIAIIFMGIIISSFNRQMFWFSNPGPILGIYAAPALYVIIRIQRAVGIYVLTNSAGKTCNPWLAECIFFDAHVLIWSMLLGVVSYAGLGSAYVPFIWLFFPFLVRETVWKYIKVFRQEVLSEYTVLAVYLLMLCIPITMTFYVLWFGMEVFIPIMGRAGSEINPEIFIGAFAYIGVIVNTSYLTSLIQTFKTMKYTRAFLLGLFLTSSLSMFSSLGFPYSGDPTSPAPKRIYLMHTARTYHDQAGYLSYEDSFLTVAPVDILGVAPLYPHIPELKNAPEIVCEPDVPYCGIPYWVPTRTVTKRLWKLPAEPPKVPVAMVIKLLSRTEVNDRTRFVFNITGPERMNAYISPRPNITMTKWSVADHIPRPNYNGIGGYTYLIHYGGGKRHDHWTLEFELKTSPTHQKSEPILDIAFAAQYKAEFKHTPEIRSFLRRQPDWLFSSPMISTYFAYVY